MARQLRICQSVSQSLTPTPTPTPTLTWALLSKRNLYSPSCHLSSVACSLAHLRDRLQLHYKTFFVLVTAVSQAQASIFIYSLSTQRHTVVYVFIYVVGCVRKSICMDVHVSVSFLMLCVAAPAAGAPAVAVAAACMSVISITTSVTYELTAYHHLTTPRLFTASIYATFATIYICTPFAPPSSHSSPSLQHFCTITYIFKCVRACDSGLANCRCIHNYFRPHPHKHTAIRTHTEILKVHIPTYRVSLY